MPNHFDKMCSLYFYTNFDNNTDFSALFSFLPNKFLFAFETRDCECSPRPIVIVLTD